MLRELAEDSIHVAAAVGNIEAVKQHLAAGTDVNAKDGEWEHFGMYYAPASSFHEP